MAMPVETWPSFWDREADDLCQVMPYALVGGSAITTMSFQAVGQGRLVYLTRTEDCDICWLLPPSSTGRGVDVSCTATVGDAPEWELCPLPDRLPISFSGGALDGQRVDEAVEAVDLSGPNAVCAG